MGCCSSKGTLEKDELDLSTDPASVANLWVCDIAENPGEPDCDFLFQADISADGNVAATRTSMQQTKGKKVCIFQSVMYDINDFQPDEEFDGRLDFKIHFGGNTAERPDAPHGWEVCFQGLIHSNRQYSGIIETSWWGKRKVVLIPYKDLSIAQKKKYPDLKGRYYSTLSNIEKADNRI